jgi:hypothetical protein
LDWPVLGGVASSDVLGNWRPRRDAESFYFGGRGHAGDDLVDVVDLLIARLSEDVLPRSVLWLGQLRAFDDALVEVVIGDDRRLPVDVADVSADDHSVRTWGSGPILTSGRARS